MKEAPVAAVAIPNQVAMLQAVRRRDDELGPYPGGGRTGGDVEMDDASHSHGEPGAWLPREV